ncbi:hypothetical protein [Streptomyces xylophagus]|uniref:hypothetical protein n=1 Tax=Streptomyces xylophagus TaxID=285514 RepID=UPI0005B8F0E5|nr:hypothetical protein [Streptomyces xylophagus]
MNRRTTLLGVAEVLAWWALLALLWLVFIRAVGSKEFVMGALAALIGAFAVWGTRRAVSGW